MAEKKLTMKRGGKGKKYFGVALDPSTGEVPLLVTRAVEYLQNCFVFFFLPHALLTRPGLYESGLFRISGQVNVISELKSQWDKGLEPQMTNQPHPHNVSGLLKLYLRELPEPLFTFSRYSTFLATAQVKTGAADRIAETKKVLDSLPPTFYATSKAVVGLLHNVASFAHINSMKASNLSMVFSSNVLRPEVETIEYIVQDTPVVNSVFEFIIENYSALFGVGGAAITQTSAASVPATASQKASSIPQPRAWQGSVPEQIGPPEMSSRNLLASAAKALVPDDDLPSWATGGPGSPRPVETPESPSAGVPSSPPAVVPSSPPAVVPAAAPAEPVAKATLDEVWAFREGSYKVITEIYELTNRITAELPNLKSLSEFVYVASIVWQARLGIGAAIEDDLLAPAIPPLVRVSNPSPPERMAHYIAAHRKIMLQYVEDIAQYVEIVAEQMSVLEAMEPLLPIDKRFCWLRDLLSGVTVATTGSGGVADPGEDATKEEDLDASILENFVEVDETGAPVEYQAPPQRPEPAETTAAAPAPAPAPTPTKQPEKPIAQTQPVLVVKPLDPAPAPVSSAKQAPAAPTQPAPAAPTRATQPALVVKPMESTPAPAPAHALAKPAVVAPISVIPPKAPAGQTVTPREPTQLNGGMLVAPIATLLDLVSIVKNDLSNVEATQQARTILELARRAKLKLEHPMESEAELLLYDASDQLDGRLSTNQQAQAVLAEVSRLLRTLSDGCSASMPATEAQVVAHVARGVTKMFAARDEAELAAIESQPD